MTECHVVRSDVCDSKVEIVQPYWASNSNGKIRAILNNDQFEQAIHQELCRYRQYFWRLFFEFQSSYVCAASRPQRGVGVTVRASRSTSGTGSWPMTPTTTAPGSSWTGSSSPPAASAGTASYFKYFVKNNLISPKNIFTMIHFFMAHL